MTEAVKGIADFAFTQLEARRVEIRCDARNEKSAAVARRAGFDLEGHLRHETRDHNNALRDTLIFSRVRDD
jgi:RimJ/RimL family protein N-acetyltransferase